MFNTYVLFLSLLTYAHCSGVRTVFNSNNEEIDHAILKGSIPLMMKEMEDNIYRFLSNEFGDLMPDQFANSSTSDSDDSLIEMIPDRNKFIFEMIVEKLSAMNIYEDVAIRLMGGMAPIFGVSESCGDASWTYLGNLFLSLLQESEDRGLPEEWVLRMFDSTGKMPDGIYSESQDFCELLEYYGDLLPFPFNCDTSIPLGGIDASLNFLKGKLAFPTGNTMAFGGFESCLSVQTTLQNGTQTNPLNIPNFKGKHMRIKIKSQSSMGPKPGSRMAPIIAGSGLLEPIIENFLNISFNGPAEDIVMQLYFGIQGTFFEIAQFSYGICVPDVCSADDIVTSAKKLFNDGGLDAVAISRDVTEENKREELDSFATSMLVIFGIICFLMLVGTVVDMWQYVNPFPPLSMQTNDSLTLKVLKSFSIYTNGKIILNTNTGKNHINCLAGIRAITMCWIIYGHLYQRGMELVSTGIIQNRQFLTEVINGNEGWGYLTITNAMFSVDTFFFMSGLLITYMTFPELEKKRFSLSLFYIHRYIRLSMPLAFTIAFVAAFPKFMSFGPIFNLDYDTTVCRDYGWRNLLYINNFFEQGGACLGQTWYLANDMQFYILSPIIFLPLWHTRKYGLLSAAAIYAVLTIVIGAVTVMYDQPPSIFFNVIPTSSDFDAFTHFYAAPYIRFQPTLIGILFGYLLHITRTKEVTIPHALNMFLWQVAIVSMAVDVYGLSNLFATNSPSHQSWSMFQSIMYNCFSKTLWSLALGWVIFSCHKGYGGVVNSFLSWKAWIPLSKLTYAAYLIHPQLQQIFLGGITSTIKFTNFFWSELFIGLAFFTFGAAFVLSISVELPFVHIEKLLLGGQRKDKKEDVVSKDNGSVHPLSNGTTVKNKEDEAMESVNPKEKDTKC